MVSQEKIDALKVLGADVRPVPVVPFDNPDNYTHQVNPACSVISPCVYKKCIVATGCVDQEGIPNRESLQEDHGTSKILHP